MALEESHSLPLTLIAGESIEVDVRYVAETTGAAWGELVVDSNDPAGEKKAEQNADTSYARELTNTFEVPVDPPVDILFAVDQSCSMDDNATDLGAAFGDFIDQIDTVTQGWQIGVVTVDNACFNEGILTSSTSNYQTKFANAVTYGSDPSGDGSNSEKLYEMIEDALAKTDPGECNAGFLRPGSMLHVIFVTDEKDRSPRNWDSYLDSYSTIMGVPTPPNPLLKLSIIGDLYKNCGDGTGLGQYEDGVVYTDGLQLNICNSGWSSEVDELAMASLTAIGDFVLSSDQVVDETVSVFVDGVEWTGDWHYDATNNSIVFDVAMEGGEEVEVVYEVYSTC